MYIAMAIGIHLRIVLCFGRHMAWKETLLLAGQTSWMLGSFLVAFMIYIANREGWLEDTG